MGIEYYLINNKTSEIYELGKGSWYAVDLNHDLTDKEKLNQFFDDEILHDRLSQEDLKYWDKIKEQIWNFTKNADPMELNIINDSDGELHWYRSQKYRFIGSRYHNELPKEINHHLNKNDYDLSLK